MLERQATSCLTRFHVFSPTSTAQLAITILNLGQYQAAQIPDLDIGLIAIDSISAFYWPDRFTVEQLRSTTLESNDAMNPIRSVFTALRSLQQSHCPVIVLTNWAVTPTGLPLLSATPITLHAPYLEVRPGVNTIEPNADGARSMHLTHHVTLFSLNETHASEERLIPRNMQFLATMRSPGSSGPAKFIISITPVNIEM